ncbi:MAG: UDP-N-acetylmuramoyl-tripeptide--D-alanyl-D-alanine ligase [Bacilli bacterium]|nr:UDP-N-acetylmuramoyl-tripeptide--D-alanyl-D-alanine ligase [Bacilli bacterium]
MTYFILSLVGWLAYMFLRTKKALHMLQQNLYDDDHRYFKWILKNRSKVFEAIDLLPLLLALYISFITNNTIIASGSIIVYGITFIVTYKRMEKESTKKPLVVTARVKRLIVTNIFLYLIPIILIVNNYQLSSLNIYIYVLILLAYFQYFVVWLSVKINIPIEKLVYLYYFNLAKKKLKRMPNLKKIGITGSYGKTSSKNILSDILNIKYTTLPTPKNFNSPYGLMITVNNYLDKFTEVFIAEMGAYKKGEVKELCDFIHPKYGILTRIGTAHLELFGSQENIQTGKFELIESLPHDGIGILNGDDPLQVNYKLKNNCQIKWIGIDNKDVDVRADNIKVTHEGTTFNVIFKGDKKKHQFETKLLGYANVYNILAAITLGYELGITIPELQKAVKRVKPIEHRLELKKYVDINIIDDAYNSNPIGSKMAVEVLGMMPGKKIIVTPGMIELGSKQYDLNKEFGIEISKTCDEVILVGKSQTKPIQDGLKEVGYPNKNIHIVNDVKEAFTLMRKLKDGDTYVLLENDLPDIFNE